MCHAAQGFSDFSLFLHHFVLAILATSSIRLKQVQHKYLTYLGQIVTEQKYLQGNRNPGYGINNKFIKIILDQCYCPGSVKI